MRLMKFRYRDGGEFMGINGDMLVQDTGEKAANGMVRVRIVDERTRYFGEEFTAYRDELSAMAACPMTQEYDHV